MWECKYKGSDEHDIPELLKAERTGHDMPGMRGVYGHVRPAMRAALKAALQARWERSPSVRAQLAPKIGHRSVGDAKQVSGYSR